MGNFWKKVDKTEFVVPAVLTLIVLIIGVVAPEAFGKLIDVLFNFVTNDLGWFYDLGIFALLIFCLWAGFGKVGKIRLGGKDAKPTISMLSWIAITFTSGMALGVVFYGVGEGLMNYCDFPAFAGIESFTAEAAENALSYVCHLLWCRSWICFRVLEYKETVCPVLRTVPTPGGKGRKGTAGQDR